MARLLSLRAWKLAGLIQQGINFPLQVFHGSEFIGKALSCEQKLLVAVGPNLLQQGLRAFEATFGAVAPVWRVLGWRSVGCCRPGRHVVLKDPVRREVRMALADSIGGRDRSQSHLPTAVSSGFAPRGEVLAVVEEQVVVLFAKAAHRSAEGDSCRRRIRVVQHAYYLSLAEL
jgi:hypothetical protein